MFSKTVRQRKLFLSFVPQPPGRFLSEEKCFRRCQRWGSLVTYQQELVGQKETLGMSCLPKSGHHLC